MTISFLKRLSGSEHTGRRISGMLVILDVLRDDRDELCERLLDQIVESSSAVTYRASTDNDTKVKCVKVENGRLLIEAVNRIGDPIEGDDKKIAMLLLVFEKVLDFKPDIGNMNLKHFEYDGLPGCYIILWQDQPIAQSSDLVCRGCGNIYDFERGAGMVTDEQVEETFKTIGAGVIKSQSSEDRRDPDLVSGNPNDEHRGVPGYVKDWLRSGKPRRWTCDGCKRVQGYSGSFFLT